VFAQRLAAVELPPEKRVDRQRHFAQVVFFGLGDEVLLHRVPIVERRVRVVEDTRRLRPEPDAAHETIVVGDAGLEVHHRLAALVVGALELLLVVALHDAAPTTAVVRLDEVGITHLLSDAAEVEEARVLRERRLEIRRRLVRFGRDHPRGRDGHPELHHRAVGGVLLHGLHGPRVVEDVEVVHQHGLFDPLSARVVPVGQAVDHHVVLAVLAQIERLDRDSLHLEAQRVAFVRDAQVELAHDPFVASRPADVGAQ
jgi:hypothetical protein